MIWFTSDMHLGHEKALDFTCRPWNQIDEMNEGIIANINEKVKENDELYILGDYSFKITALEAAALRKKIYMSIEQSQVDINVWMNSHNTQKTHS